jgi:hypothetical protein
MIRQLLIAFALASIATQRRGYPPPKLRLRWLPTLAANAATFLHSRRLSTCATAVSPIGTSLCPARASQVQHDGAWSMVTTGHYDGTDAQQADFDAWTRRLVASFPH